MKNVFLLVLLSDFCDASLGPKKSNFDLSREYTMSEGIEQPNFLRFQCVSEPPGDLVNIILLGFHTQRV